MKRVISAFTLLLVLCFGFSTTLAETITIDLETASYEEIVAAYELLKNERLERLKENFVSEHQIQPVSGITFRKVPWGSTKTETEGILGNPSSYSRSYITASAGFVYTDGMGVQTEYKNWTLAGYPLECAELNYVYPVVDGILIRDDSSAILYLAEYDIWDVGDTNAVVEDLTTKLSRLYGTYTSGSRDKRTWTDENGNFIELGYSSSRVYLIYSSVQAEELLGRAYQAIQDERREQEELLRIQNQNNTDGL